MERISEFFKAFCGREPETCEPVTGSGSNRKYFRIRGGDLSVIGVIGTDSRENDAFITLSRHFRSKGLPVPEVLEVSEDRMMYLQEDLGRDMLSDRIASVVKEGWTGRNDELMELLKKTVSILPRFQYEGAEGLDFSVCYPQPSFDRRMVMFDLNYFKYCFLKSSGLEFNEALLQDDFERLADDLLSEDFTTFMYRDFNARNVMIKEGEPYFIDFQGGRKGPVHYDAASFIWQARSAYPAEVRKALTDCYADALSEYVPVDRERFDVRLRLFVLFRLLQVLGAYGFRGWTEHKAQFLTVIPQAVSALKGLLEVPFREYPYLDETLRRMAGLPRFRQNESDGRLTVKVYSFSYRKGVPEDPSGNGGGYIFDCRSIHNPGRYEPYKKLTGRDEAVINFLEEDGGVTSFLENVYGLMDPHVETYIRRGFTDLMAAFGCTGGQHRSVYCAEHLARHLADRYPEARVVLIHREQNIRIEL